MKKLLLLVVCVFIVNFSYGQMTVTDVGVTTQVTTGNVKSAAFFSKSLAEAAKQFQKLTELKDQFIEDSKLVRVVNSAIANGKQMVRIKNNLAAITREYSNGINYVKNEPLIDVESKTQLMVGYSKKLAESLDHFEDATNFISDSFQMNDAERIKMLNESNEKLEFQKGFIIYLNNKVKYNVKKIKDKKGTIEFLSKEYKSINKEK